MEPLIVVLVVLLVVWSLVRAVRIVPVCTARTVARFGRHHRTLSPGIAVVVPFLDRVGPPIDLREQVVSRVEEPVITEEDVIVLIDATIHFSVVDPRAAAETPDHRYALERLAVTTLRTAVGAMPRERALTAHADLGHRLREALLPAGARWGLWVSRVEVTAVAPITSGAERR